METTPNEFKSNLGHIKENVKQGVKQGLDKTGWQDTYNMAQERAREAMDISEDFVKSHPFYTILGAAAVGLVAGLLISRK